MRSSAQRPVRGRRRRWTRAAIAAGVALGAAASGLYAYYGYAPGPREPDLRARVLTQTVTVAGVVRSYTAVVPTDLPPESPLLFVLHGSGQDAAAIREHSGYGFDRLAVEHGFAVVYPDAYQGYWNDCRAAAENPARDAGIDDAALLERLVEMFAAASGVNPTRVFAAGYSNGGQLVLRLATEHPERFAGLAAIAATWPTPDNNTCADPRGPVAMLLMNGTADPIVPFNGGEITIFGFASRGTAISAAETTARFVRVNDITDPGTSTTATHRKESGRTAVTSTSYRQPGKQPVLAYTVHGGGHVMPSAGYRPPRVLGPTTRDIDAPSAVWAFFTDHQPAPVTHRPYGQARE